MVGKIQLDCYIDVDKGLKLLKVNQDKNNHNMPRQFPTAISFLKIHDKETVATPLISIHQRYFLQNGIGCRRFNIRLSVLFGALSRANLDQTKDIALRSSEFSRNLDKLASRILQQKDREKSHLSCLQHQQISVAFCQETLLMAGFLQY